MVFGARTENVGKIIFITTLGRFYLSCRSRKNHLLQARNLVLNIAWPSLKCVTLEYTAVFSWSLEFPWTQKIAEYFGQQNDILGRRIVRSVIRCCTFLDHIYNGKKQPTLYVKIASLALGESSTD
jgi:hypothetical protein